MEGRCKCWYVLGGDNMGEKDRVNQDTEEKDEEGMVIIMDEADKVRPEPPEPVIVKNGAAKTFGLNGKRWILFRDFDPKGVHSYRAFNDDKENGVEENVWRQRSRQGNWTQVLQGLAREMKVLYSGSTNQQIGDAIWKRIG